MGKGHIVLLFFILFSACEREANKTAEKSHKTEIKTDRKVLWLNKTTGDTVFRGAKVPFITQNGTDISGGVRVRKKNPVKIEKTYQKKIRNFTYPVQRTETYQYSVDSAVYLTKTKMRGEAPRKYTATSTIASVIEPDRSIALPMGYKDNSLFETRFLSTEQGLPSPNVYAALKDNRGAMWFGTDNGLVQYDGKYIKVYKTENGLPDNKIKVLKEDKNGLIWIGTETKGLVSFDGKTFRTYTLDSVSPGVPITDILIDTRDNIWMTIRFGGLVQFDGSHMFSYKEEQGIHTNRPTSSLAMDKHGDLWISGYGRALYRYNEKKGLQLLSHKSGIKLGYAHKVMFDNNGTMYLGEFGYSLLKISNDTVSRYLINRHLAGNYANILQDHKNNIWAFSLESGAYKFSENQVEHYGVENGFSSEMINSAYYDDLGQFWLSTEGGGVVCFNPYSYEMLNQYNGAISKYFNNVVELDNNKFIYATDLGLAFRQDSTLTFIEANPIKQAAADNKGNVYSAVSNFGIQWINGNNTFRMGGNASDAPQNPNCVSKQGDSIFWFGTSDNNGVYRWSGDELIRYNNNSGIYFRNIISILYDSENRLWLGSENQGVAVIENDSISYFANENGITDDKITCIYEDSEKRVWFCTASGLFYYKNRFVKVNLPHSYNHDIKGISQDKNSNYWIITGSGLLCLVPKINKAEWDIENYFIYKKDKSSGLISDAFRDNSFMIDSKGHLHAGTEAGLVTYTPSNIVGSEIKTYITNIVVNNQNIVFSNYNKDSLNNSGNLFFSDYNSLTRLPVDLKLKHTQNNLKFYFSGIYWHNPSELKFKYYLDGFDDRWVNSGDEGFAEYKNLPFGNYNLKVAGFLPDGRMSEEVSLTFEILRPWWHSWWARVFYALVVLGLFVSILRIRTNALKKRQKQLETEITNATKEIRSQKEEIEEAHNNIKDSLSYAKRIQTAILPPQKLVKEYLPESFVLYKPKDIVAGDFYWMEHLGSTILFAAADCTGHGVPGAMVSVVCHNALNRSIREYKLNDPGKILDKTREIVMEEFEKSEEEVKDGMDISLCAYNSQTGELKWAGANNPLWIIRSGQSKVEEIKGDKQPIGKYAEEKPFTTHSLQLYKGDSVYVFTDGYQDQFGGEKGKKYKAGRIKEVLININHQSMDEQRRRLEEEFSNWQGKQEQVDDVTFIGIRV